MPLSISLILLLLPACLFGQAKNLVSSDSLRLDSLAKQLIRTGELDLNTLSNSEMDKVFEIRRLLESRAAQSRLDLIQEKLSGLEKERQQLRDSIITSLPLAKENATKLRLAGMLIQIGDSVSLQYLVTHLDIVFVAEAWHSNTWGQYPLAKMLCQDAKNNMSYYSHIRDELGEKVLEDPIQYFYAEMLSSIFRGEEEILYINLNKLVQQFSENETLKTNVQTIKNILKNN